MPWSVTATVSRFAEAVSWFRARLPLTSQAAAAMSAYSGPRAFTIAGVTQLEVVNDVHASLLEAIETGVPFAEWKALVEQQLTAAWGKKDSPRVLLIFRNATSQAHNAGRWRQLNEPAVRALRPYIFFDGVSDSRQSDICRAWDGTIRPIDDPCWEVASPQLHHACRSQLRSLRESDALQRGVTPALPEEQAAPGFGKVPTAAEWSPDPSRYPRELFDEYALKRRELESTTERPAF
jgi:SPP1 gp7 family putative phage head morphogenesis protein